MVDRLALTLRPGTASVAPALDQLRAFLRTRRIEPRPTYVVELAAEELISNALSYGFTDPAEGELHVELEIAADRLWLRLRDTGVPFDPSASPDPRPRASLEETPVGGRGISLVRRMSDGVTYRRNGQENRVEVLVLRPRDEVA